MVNSMNLEILQGIIIDRIFKIYKIIKNVVRRKVSKSPIVK